MFKPAYLVVNMDSLDSNFLTIMGAGNDYLVTKVPNHQVAYDLIEGVERLALKDKYWKGNNALVKGMYYSKDRSFRIKKLIPVDENYVVDFKKLFAI